MKRTPVTRYWRLDRWNSSAVKPHCSHYMSKIHYCHCQTVYWFLFFFGRPLSLFLICWHLMDLSSPTTVFCCFFFQEIEQQLIERQLAADIPHHSPLPYRWLHFPPPLCDLLQQTAFLNYNLYGDTQKRWLSGSGILAILHVSHPLAITSANKLARCARGEACIGTLGGEDVRRGLGVWRGGLEESVCSMLSLRISKWLPLQFAFLLAISFCCSGCSCLCLNLRFS